MMTDTNSGTPTNNDRETGTLYEIRVQGHLNKSWANWFDGLVITLEENGETLLCGPVADQSALYGLLRKIRNLGLPLLSLNCLKTAEMNEQDVETLKQGRYPDITKSE